MSTKMRLAFAMSQNMICSLRRLAAKPSPSYLLTKSLSLRTRSTRVTEPIEVDSELDMTSLDALLRSKPALLRR